MLLQSVPKKDVAWRVETRTRRAITPPYAHPAIRTNTRLDDNLESIRGLRTLLPVGLRMSSPTGVLVVKLYTTRPCQLGWKKNLRLRNSGATSGSGKAYRNELMVRQRHKRQLVVLVPPDLGRTMHPPIDVCESDIITITPSTPPRRLPWLS